MPDGGGAEVAGAVQVDVTFLVCLCGFEDPNAWGLVFQLFRRAVAAPDPVAIVVSRTLLTREFTWRRQLPQPVPRGQSRSACAAPLSPVLRERRGGLARDARQGDAVRGQFVEEVAVGGVRDRASVGLAPLGWPGWPGRLHRARASVGGSKSPPVMRGV